MLECHLKVFRGKRFRLLKKIDTVDFLLSASQTCLVNVLCVNKAFSVSLQDHIMEIFSTYGKIKMIDMPVDRLNPHLSKGYAYVEFENPDDAEKALKHMDGGRY